MHQPLEVLGEFSRSRTQKGPQKPRSRLPRVLPHTRDRHVLSFWDPDVYRDVPKTGSRDVEDHSERHRFHQTRVAAGRTVYMQVRAAPYLFALRALCYEQS